MADPIGFGPAFTNMGASISENVYRGLFDALGGAKNVFAQVKDPALARARPFYDAGLIQTWQDLQKLIQAGYDPQLAGLAAPATPPPARPTPAAPTAAQKTTAVFGPPPPPAASAPPPKAEPPSVQWAELTRRRRKELSRSLGERRRQVFLESQAATPAAPSQAATPAAPSQPASIGWMALAQQRQEEQTRRSNLAEAAEIVGQTPPRRRPGPTASAKAGRRRAPSRTRGGKLGGRWAQHAGSLFGQGEDLKPCQQDADDRTTRKLIETMEKLGDRIEKDAAARQSPGQKLGLVEPNRPGDVRQPGLTAAGRDVQGAMRQAFTVGRNPGVVENLVASMASRAVMTALAAGS